MMLADVEERANLPAAAQALRHREPIVHTMQILHFVNLIAKASSDLKMIPSLALHRIELRSLYYELLWSISFQVPLP